MSEEIDYTRTHDDGAEQFMTKLAESGVALNNRFAFGHILRYLVPCEIVHNTSTKANKDYMRVLDIGCSSVTWYKFWKHNFNAPGRKRIDYTGLEVREALIKKFQEDQKNQKRESVDKVRMLQFDLCKQSLTEHFKDEAKFDFVLCQEIIEHIGTENADKMLEGIKSILSDDGIFILSTPNPKKERGEQFVFPENHIYEFPFAEMTTLLEKHGFKIENHFGYLCGAHDINKGLADQYKPIYDKISETHKYLAYLMAGILDTKVSDCYVIVSKKSNENSLDSLF